MRKITVIMLALSLAGCASAPKPSITHNAPSIAHKTAKVAPVEQPEAKPASFRQRWFDRFMKHKSK